MDDNEQSALKERFQDAIDGFIDKIKDDPNVIAVLVGGSFAYDVLWEKSDIDMMIIVRDLRLNNTYISLVEDGITINAGLIPRSSFKRGMEGSIGGSFFQSFITNGKIVYSNDESPGSDNEILPGSKRRLLPSSSHGILQSPLREAPTVGGGNDRPA